MNNETIPALRAHVMEPALRGAAALFVLTATLQLQAADLIKADNTIDLGTAGSYTSAAAVPTASDMIVFDSTLATNAVFSWTANRAVLGVKLVNPANAITVNLNGATYDFSNSAGTVIDLSSATKNLTFAAVSSAALIRVRGSSADGATLSVASGTTLRIQSNVYYNNVLTNTTSTIKVTGAGNVTVDGTNGRVSDKNLGNGSLTALKHEGTGTLTLSNTNTYSGGTSITSGTLVAGVAGALGGGSVTVGGGTLDLNGSGIVNLALASNKDFALSSGTLKFNLGTSSDQITGSGTGKFNLTGGTFVITQGTGFDYGIIYQVFSGFTSGTSTVSGLTFTGFDTDTYQASLNNLGQLSFSLIPIPEPSTYAVIVGGLLLVGTVLRRRRLT